MDASKKFTDQFLMPRVHQDFKNQSSGKEIMKKFGQQGFLGCTLKGFNLPGVSSVSYGLINRQIQRADSAYRSALSVQSSLIIHPINQFGTQQQKNKYIPKLASGQFVGCFGLTQPDHGSDPGTMKAKAIKDGNEYILTGQKTWITNSPIADIFIVWVKDQKQKVRGFILQKDMKGLSAIKIKVLYFYQGKLSLNASITGNIILDQVRVPVSQMLQVQSLKGPFSCLNNARFGISWGTLGAAQQCFHTATKYLLNRKQFDVPLAAFQIPQKKLADMQTQIALGLLGVIQLSRLKDAGQLAPEMISMMKRNNASKSLGIARQARDLLGASGITQQFNIMRHLINLQTVNTYEGTNDIHALIIGRGITGIEAFTRTKPKLPI